MAHMVETMAYAGETPWHGLGTNVPADLGPIQMMQKAGCDWSVEKRPIYTCNDGIADQVIRGKQALVRDCDNTVLDIVGDDWNPVQNAEAFEFFHEYCMAGDMEMHTAGSLDNGRNVWVLAKVKESFSILGDDQVDSYLLFSNPHMYGKAIDVRFTPIRVVCNNTLTMSLGQKAANGVKIGHRTKFDPEMVKLHLGIAHDKFEKYKEVAEFLSSKRYTAESLINYYNDVFPHTYAGSKGKNVLKFEDLTKNAKAAHDVLETQPGAKFGEGTFWSAFNSVTYMTDHLMGRSAESRLNSAWFGQNQTRKVRALEKAVEYAEAV
jgi:phage/plasmid-like protein (TIGR03299 family)